MANIFERFDLANRKMLNSNHFAATLDNLEITSFHGKQDILCCVSQKAAKNTTKNAPFSYWVKECHTF